MLVGFQIIPNGLEAEILRPVFCKWSDHISIHTEAWTFFFFFFEGLDNRDYKEPQNLENM